MSGRAHMAHMPHTHTCIHEYAHSQKYIYLQIHTYMMHLDIASYIHGWSSWRSVVRHTCCICDTRWWVVRCTCCICNTFIHECVHSRKNAFHLQIHAYIMYSQIHTYMLMSDTAHTPRLSHTATQCTALQHSLAQNALTFWLIYCSVLQCVAV